MALADEERAEIKKKLHGKARRGVLKEIMENDGTLALAEVHEYTLKKFFIQHQGFSELLEGMVSSKLIEVDKDHNNVTITEEGKNYS